MKETLINKFGWKRLLSVSAAVGVLLVMTAIFAKDWRYLNSRDNQDLPPVIEFTWTPLGEVDLKEFRGFLSIRDDYGLDFTTYRLHIVEIDKTYDLPIDGLIGREYESPISLGLLMNNPDVTGKRQLTLRFSISDDRGQESSLERIVRIKPIPVSDVLSADGGFQVPIELEIE